MSFKTCGEMHQKEKKATELLAHAHALEHTHTRAHAETDAQLHKPNSKSKRWTCQGVTMFAYAPTSKVEISSKRNGVLPQLDMCFLSFFFLVLVLCSLLTVFLRF